MFRTTSLLSVCSAVGGDFSSPTFTGSGSTTQIHVTVIRPGIHPSITQWTSFHPPPLLFVPVLRWAAVHRADSIQLVHVAAVTHSGLNRDKEQTECLWRCKSLCCVCAGITVLLSLTVFMLLVAEIMPATSDSVPLIGETFTQSSITSLSSFIRHLSPGWI